MRKTEVVIAGIGMGNPETATVQVIRAIESADVLIGSERMLEPFKSYGKKMISEYRSDAIADIIKKEGLQKYAVLVSGDPGLYSGAESIAEALAEFHPRVMPGVSSVSYFCSSIGKTWDDAEVISASGRRVNIASEVRRNKKTFVLTEGNISEMLGTLCEYGFGDIHVHVGECLSYPEEKITEGTAAELSKMKFDDLAVMLIINENADSTIPSGLGDELFERGNVVMTKREVRATTMSALKVLQDSVVYDVGAGTGSVAIEAAYAAYRGTVYAIECDEEAVEVMKRNCRRMTTDNVVVVSGTAPEAFVELPAADLVFIGGSDGSLEGIVDALIVKNKDAKKDFRLVISAVSMRTIASSVAMLSTKRALKIEYTQVSSYRSRAASVNDSENGQEPMFIIKADFKLK